MQCAPIQAQGLSKRPDLITGGSDLRSFAIVFVLLSLLGSAASAQKAEDHIAMCLSDDLCESMQKQFKREYPKAYRGDYGSQRNVSFCLADGCRGAVQQNRPLGCAWRLVIIASGSSRVDSTDTDFFEAYCAKRLSPIERVQMRSQAEVLFRQIYKRSLPSGL